MPRPANNPKLSKREREVAELVSRGLTNAEIGQTLFISEETVKTHLTNICNRKGFRNRVELAVWWVRRMK